MVTTHNFMIRYTFIIDSETSAWAGFETTFVFLIVLCCIAVVVVSSSAALTWACRIIRLRGWVESISSMKKSMVSERAKRNDRDTVFFRSQVSTRISVVSFVVLQEVNRNRTIIQNIPYVRRSMGILLCGRNHGARKRGRGNQDAISE